MQLDSRILKAFVVTMPPHADRSVSGAHVVSIEYCRNLDPVERFLRETNAEDRYLRFGNCGIGTVGWLIERIRVEPGRGVYLARSGEAVIALLDFAAVNDEIEFGILVRSDQRHQGIGRALVRSFLTGIARSHPDARVVAFCDSANRPARRFLRSLRMRAMQIAQEDWRFETIPAPRN